MTLALKFPQGCNWPACFHYSPGDGSLDPSLFTLRGCQDISDQYRCPRIDVDVCSFLNLAQPYGRDGQAHLRSIEAEGNES